MTRYELFVQRWGGGCGGEHCAKTRRPGTRICLDRGDRPCDVLFLGEGPGPSEDSLGRPFVGPAGHLLDRIAAEGLLELRACGLCRKGHVWSPMVFDGTHYLCKENGHGEEHGAAPRCGFSNLVCCRPLDEFGQPTMNPPPEQVTACADRLRQYITQIAKPRLIVCVGGLAEEWLLGKTGFGTGALGGRLAKKSKYPVLDGWQGQMCSIVHPAAILRTANVVRQPLMYKEAVGALQEAAEGLK